MTLRIAHTADIHIRSLSRHEEYREVFTQFIKDCKKSKVDHIFVGGDIFHTKTSGISPEYIDFLTWWLEAMSKVAPVHLTLGNHDGNLVNLSRQDAVSPIVAALDNPRIHLYKKSGMYEFHPGYVWCIYSLFDEEGWKDVKPVDGKVNIACYHGPVRGSKTETGWEIEDGLMIDFFKDYALVLLGDIHKMQFLDFKEIEIEIDEDELFKYPGCTIVE
jgi:DNA repair exonuclease SbcCD nuclease subunit